MKVLLTGSSGRVGRAIYGALAASHDVIGLDRQPFATTNCLAELSDIHRVRQAMAGVEVLIHTAALHAPHVGKLPDAEFQRINVDAVAVLIDLALSAGVRRLIFTSTTALYGYAVTKGACTWIDLDTEPQPRTIYHRSKLQAEALLASAAGPDLEVRIIRMSRCFPEPVDQMAVYRLHRGIDARDVGLAHRALLDNPGPAFQRYIASASTPFLREDIPRLAIEPASVVGCRQPDLVRAFNQRGWPFRTQIDRVYDASALAQAVGWHSRYGFDEVLREYDRHSLEVLPYRA